MTILHKKNIKTLGYACGIGAGKMECCMGPHVLQHSPYIAKANVSLDWIDHLLPRSIARGFDAIPSIAEVNQRLAQHAQLLTENKQHFAVVGGDHSSSIGTWSGVASALDGPLGLLWIDAHMDAHTPETSFTHNVHGMPLAVLLGYGDKQLTQLHTNYPKILPENVCLVGVRSFEESEQVLLEKLGVRIFYMEDIAKSSLDAVMQAAFAHVNQHTVGYGITIDLDAVEPEDAPGVGFPEWNGIAGADLCRSLAHTKYYRDLLALEIVEFNPREDQEQKTEQLVLGLLEATWGNIGIEEAP